MGTEVQRRVQAAMSGALPEGVGWVEGLARYGRALRSEYLAHRDGALCLLSDPNLAGSRSFIAADPDQVRIEDRTAADLFGARTDQGLDAGVVGLAAYDAGARAGHED